jgi:hypothetical protein
VPNTLVDGDDYQVKITWDTYNGIVGTSSNFSIKKPTITVTQPVAGGTWKMGTLYQILWASPVLGNGFVKIELYKGTVLIGYIYDSESNDGSYDWKPPYTLVEASDYKIVLTWLTDTSVVGESGIFTIGPPDYIISITSPSAGVTWYQKTSVDIIWTTTCSPAGYVKIELLKSTVVVATIVSGTLNDGSCSWTVPNTLVDGDDYQVKITWDTYNGIVGTSSNFSIKKPTITVTQPAAGVSWAKSTTHDIIWTSPVLGSGIVKIELYKGTVLTSTIDSSTSNDGSYRWTLSSLLTAGTDYVVKITWLTDYSVYGESGVFSIIN